MTTRATRTLRDDERTHGLWAKTAPPFETSRIEGSAVTDVVVIGGGYTGLSTALHLRQLGVQVVVLEAVDIGFGGSGRNVGLVNAGLWVRPQEVIRSLGQHYGERVLGLLGDAPSLVFELILQHSIQCEATRAGTLHCAVGPPGAIELEQRYVQWSQLGAPVELLNATESAAKIGSTAFAGALLDRRAGTVQPLAYARGLAKAATTLGAQIFSGRAVESVKRVNGAWQVATSGGVVTSSWIVVATDVYSAGPWSALREEQVRLPYFNVATKPLGGRLLASILPERQGAWSTQCVLTSFRVDQAGRLVFGSVGALKETGLNIHRAWAKRAIQSTFPQLDDVEFEAEWFGTIGMTSDNMPRFHKLAPNVVTFSGYNGRGIAPGTAFGRVLAHYVNGLITDADMPLPTTLVGQPALRRCKEVIYEFGSMLVHWLSARR
jgi:glycine/D-amino acid oxidase-like deaminating enzyme